MRAPLLLSAFGATLALGGCTDTTAGPEAGALSLETRDALELLPGDARVAGMMNVRAAREAGVSPFGDAAGPFSGLEGESAARFAEFVRLTGFQPERDVERVYVAASPEAGGEAAPAFVVYADFERARLGQYLDGQTAELTKTQHGGVDMYVASNPDGDGQAFAVAVPGEDYLLAGGEAAVRQMIDRAAAGNAAGSMAQDAGAMALVRRAAYPDGAWFVARDMPTGDEAHDSAGEGGPGAAFGQAGQLIDDAVVSADFDAEGVTFTALGLTRPGADAGDVADLIRGGVSAARASSAGDANQMALLDGVRVREVAGGVEVRGTMPRESLAALSTLR